MMTVWISFALGFSFHQPWDHLVASSLRTYQQIYNFLFKVDRTAPTITLTVLSLNALKTKWLLNATVDDATSGVALVEFYIDDVLVANVTAPGPYTYEYKGNGQVAQAIVYDMAGNSAMSEQKQDYIPGYNSQDLLNPNTQQLSYQQILLQK